MYCVDREESLYQIGGFRTGMLLVEVEIMLILSVDHVVIIWME